MLTTPRSTVYVRDTVVRVLIVDPALKEIVLVKSANRASKWELPGGNVEKWDTSPEAAARREAREETGISLDKLTHHGSIDQRRSKRGLVVTRHYVFSSRVRAPRVIIDDTEIIDFQLATLKRLWRSHSSK